MRSITEGPVGCGQAIILAAAATDSTSILAASCFGKPDHALILGIALESKIANLKSLIRIPRGVTVTQRPLEALFLVRIQAG